MDFERLDEIAAKLMKNRRAHLWRETGSVYYHGARTARGVIRLREMATSDDSYDDILRCAAMFHDVGKGLEPHGHYGSAIAREALADEISPQELGEVLRLIESHYDRKPESDAHDLWVRLLQDADLLDHIGTYEIWMSCNYYAYRQEPMEKLEEWYVGPFDREVEKYHEKLNFDFSREILKSKVAFEREFIRRYLIERTGDYVMDEAKHHT